MWLRPFRQQSQRTIDLVIVVSASTLGALAFGAVDAYERFYLATRTLEPWEIDEAAIVLCLLLVGMVWYSHRRQRELREAHEQLKQLAPRLLEAQEQERRRIAMELHDEAGQLLTALELILSPDREGSPAGGLTPNQVRKAKALVGQLTEEVRDVSLSLRPTMLDDLGLAPTLTAMLRRYSSETNVDVRFDHDGMSEQRFSAAVETTFYRVVQEALTNLTRHAKASGVRVRLWTTADKLNLEVIDNGIGFDAAAASRRHQTAGLSGMRERVESVGGTLTVASTPNKGTHVRAVAPVVS